MSLSKKLQLKAGQAIRLVNAPDGLEVDAEISEGPGAGAVLVFVRNREELEQHAGTALEQARDDVLSWIAYPKGGQLGTDLNRDILWKLLEDKGVRPVRQISIDEVWSALRFRPSYPAELPPDSRG